jgi:hypothetical protein
VLGTLVEKGCTVELGGGFNSTLTGNLRWPTEATFDVQLLLGVGYVSQRG